MKYEEFDQIKIEELKFFNPQFLKAKFYPNNILTLGDLFRLYETTDFINIFASSSGDISKGIYEMMNGNLKLLRYEYLGIDPMLDDLKNSTYFYDLSSGDLRKLGFSEGAVRGFSSQTKILLNEGAIQNELPSIADIIMTLYENSNKIPYGTAIFQTTKEEYQEKMRILYKYFKNGKVNDTNEVHENIAEIKLLDIPFIKPANVKKSFFSNNIYTIQDLLNCNDEELKYICSMHNADVENGLYETVSGTIKLLRYKYLGEELDFDLAKIYIDTNNIYDDKNKATLRKLGYSDACIKIILTSIQEWKKNQIINSDEISVKDVILSIADYKKQNKLPYNTTQTSIDEFKTKTRLMIQHLKNKENQSNIELLPFTENKTIAELENEKARLILERAQLDSKIESVEQRISNLKKGGASVGKY